MVRNPVQKLQGIKISEIGIFKSWLSSHTLAGLAMCPVCILSKNKRVKTTQVVT